MEQSGGGKTRGCFCLKEQECGVSFRRQRDTEGRGWQPSEVSEAATETPLDARGCIPAHMGSLEHGGRQWGLEIPMRGSCC